MLPAMATKGIQLPEAESVPVVFRLRLREAGQPRGRTQRHHQPARESDYAGRSG